MHPRKKQYVNEVYKLTTQICCLMSEDKELAIPNVLNISNHDAREIIKKILIGLPDYFFYNATPAVLYDILGMITRNLILFQAQENIDEENYVYHLIHFINGLTTAIASRYYPNSV